MFKSRKGQGWTVDYTISFLLFILATTITVKIFTNTFTGNEFEEVKREAQTISEHLLSKGNPEYWDSSDVVRIGLAESKNRLNPVKIDNFLELNYSSTRNNLGIRHDYAFYFRNRNDTVIGMKDQCVLGSPSVSETKTLESELLPTAYYFKQDSFMSGEMTSLKADFYDGTQEEETNSFYRNLSQYRFVMMENPEISSSGAYTRDEKRKRLERYVRKGGILFLSQNVSLNMTGVGFKNASEYNGNVVEEQDDHLELTNGYNLTDNDQTDRSYTVEDLSADNFTALGEYGSGDAWIARWESGLGRGYYFATIDADYSDDGNDPVDMNTKAGEGAESVVNVTMANCTDIGVDELDSDNIARVERLAIHDSELVKMVVVAWN